MMPRFICVLPVLCAAASAQTAAAPQAQSGIFGRVVNAHSREPVRRAAVKVYTPKNQWDDLTDSDGRFRFPDLAPGEYTLIVHRDGYTDRAYTIDGSDFAAQKELPIEVYPQGVIAGRVVDGLGHPLESATIEARASRANGSGIEVIGSTKTNDLGEYRLSGLDPGVYRVHASYREGRDSEFDPTPLRMATADYGVPGKAIELIVKSGSLTSGIDFTLQAARPARIRGTLHTESGALVTDRTTLWIYDQANGGGHNGRGENGKFEVPDAAPGIFTISAQTRDEAAPFYGSTTVEVHSGDVEGIDLVLRPMPIIEGEIQIEGGGSADLTSTVVYFRSANRANLINFPVGRPVKDRRFKVPLIPGEYDLVFNASVKKLGIRSVTLDGKPITNWKLQIGPSPQPKKLVIVVGQKEQP